MPNKTTDGAHQAVAKLEDLIMCQQAVAALIHPDHEHIQGPEMSKIAILSERLADQVQESLEQVYKSLQ